MYLHNTVVQAGLKARRGLLGDRVTEFVEGLVERKLGSDVRKRIAGCLRRKSGGAGQASVDLNDVVGHAVGVQGILNVAFTNDSNVTHDLIPKDQNQHD
jgi:hypothetical protein